ncbi:hypothetical protein MKZ38_007075 [Zalerion maritima]|uniref:Aminoglycoside phosphotransferase domain-containing protein n=1 Tax=Zalerion maritima TaxID=339359 RepID=A0AAD5RJA5_9PEZI|nr:hypothetical protein MKZ38_007075 [Zalerion maritima]
MPCSPLTDVHDFGGTVSVDFVYGKCGGRWIFRKTEKEDASFPTAEQRYRNEAAALKLLAERTSIPVPKLIYCGPDDNGKWCLETEFLSPTMQAATAADICRMPHQHRPSQSNNAFCKHCDAIVRGNVAHFIQNTVLPQLHGLRASSTGIEGVVIPPPWVFRTRPAPEGGWTSKASQSQEYVFCHNDLHELNILVDIYTLKVCALIDWEYSGFFPAPIQHWHYDYNKWKKMFDNKEIIDRDAQLLS